MPWAITFSPDGANDGWQEQEHQMKEVALMSLAPLGLGGACGSVGFEPPRAEIGFKTVNGRWCDLSQRDKMR